MAVRNLLGLMALGLGSGLGYAMLPAPLGWVVGATTGLSLALGTFLFKDGLRAQRLSAWLADKGSLSAPAVVGPLGDLAFRMERALRLREGDIVAERDRMTQLLSAIEVSPNGMLLLDGQDQLRWMNRTAAEHFQLDQSRDLDQRITNLVRAPSFVAYMQAGEFGSSLKFGCSASVRTLSIVVRRFGNDMKVVLSHDETDRERTDAMRRDFVANVSHEIRSPLTVMMGFLETLTDLPLTLAERSRALIVMKQQTERMQNLVADLLTLAKIEASPPPLDTRWICVSALLTRIEAEAKSLDCSRHRILLNLSVDAEISGSETEIFSAMWNLVSNALRYTPEAGVVRLDWSVDADGCGLFAVIDTGPGIAKEHIPRLTERFYRVDGSRSRDTGGTGLGLAIVKHVIQRHGGDLEIQSLQGVGSEFKLRVPAHRVRKAGAEHGQDALAA